MSVQFTVTAQADLHQLQTFLEGKGKNTRVYGKEDQGVVTLYLKPEATTTSGKIKDKIKRVFSGLIGNGHKRREAARKGINQLVERVSNQQHLVETHGKYVIDLLKDSALAGYSSNSGKANRAGELFKNLKMINEMVAKSKPITTPVEQILTEAGLGKETEVSFLKGKEMVLKPTTEGVSITIGPLMFDNKVYEPKQHLATGGFGHVVRYESNDGHSIAFKIGIPGKDPESNEKAMRNLAKEIKAHRTLHAKNPESVIKLHSALRIKGDLIGVAMEYAKLGDMQTMSAKIRNAIAPTGQQRVEGQLTPQEGRLLLLTMVKDMARSLAAMHKNNVSHLDFKSGNMLINDSGEGVVTDFGTLSGQQKVYGHEMDGVQNFAYKSPEYSKATHHLVTKGFHNLVSDVVKQDKNELLDHLSNLLSASDPGEVEKTVNNIYQARQDIVQQSLEGTVGEYKKDKLLISNPQKIDVWGLGASVVELLTGDPIMSNEPEAKTSNTFAFNKRLRDFHTSTENAVQPRQQNGSLAGESLVGSTGDNDLDDFLNWVLKSDPKDRPTAQQILEHPLLNAKGVGSIEAYDLIKSLGMEGDTTELVEAARTNFLDEIGTDDN